jgi:hypothetical protein
MQALTSANVAAARATPFAGAARSLRASPVACAAGRRTMVVAAAGRPMWCAPPPAPRAAGDWRTRRGSASPPALRRANASAIMAEGSLLFASL